MTENESYFVSLVKSAIEGVPAPDMPSGASFASVCALAGTQMLGYCVYTAVCGNPAFAGEKALARLQADAFAEATRRSVCDSEYAKLAKILDEKKICYMPLKGLEARKLYPDPLMRQMSDMDIMYSGRGLEKAMKQLSYSSHRHTGGKLCFKKPPFVNFEAQRTLLRNEPLGKEYSDILALSVQGEGFAREMKPEYFYIYHILHSARHYFGGGVGLRALADIRLFREKYPDCDRDFIYSELKKCSLDGFARNMEKLTEYFFGQYEGDEKIRLMGQYVLNSGAYGSERFGLERELNESGNRGKLFLSKLFPPMSIMKSSYPPVAKCGALLPAFWVWHNIRRIPRLGSVLHKAKSVGNADGERLSRLETLMRISREG